MTARLTPSRFLGSMPSLTGVGTQLEGSASLSADLSLEKLESGVISLRRSERLRKDELILSEFTGEELQR